MVEALVGWLVCPVIKIVVDKARCCISDRIKWLSGGVPETLGKLGETLVKLGAVAGAVEKRTSAGISADLRLWLQQLKDAVHDAADVLDDFDGSAPQPGYIATAGRRIIGADEALNRLKVVVETLEAIYTSSDKLMQAAELEASRSGDLSGHHSPHGRATGSVFHRKEAVLGRDKELRDMVSWLVGPSDGEAQSVSVPIAAIMGHGGMGKTTLARLLFQDQTVKSTFDLKIWVEPSAMENELELAKQILQSQDVVVPPGMSSFDWLQKKLMELVSSHKFLLVIDNVWNKENMEEHDYQDMWSKVLAPLSHGKTESKIVVTTRQRMVARLLKSSKQVWLDGLPADDTWSLFKRCAFGEEDMEKQHPELRDIGREIAQKLKGSPLAVKAVGQMLGGSRSVTHWMKVLKMDSFERVSSTLKLCYHSLPDHLQPCFAICSIFPKNFRFKRDKLVKIWMALDFVQPDDRNTRLEDIGSEYFDQLVDRSFFHKQKLGRRRYYYIHDLMHDLAEEVSRFDCMRVEGVNKEIPKTVRHLSVSRGDDLMQLKNRCELKRLRTLVILSDPSSSLNQLPGDLLTELKGLRVLSLEGCSIMNLPERIGHLKHLRYLALCKSITRLPQTVTKLYHLQTLRSPKGSRLEGIPKDIANLKCLRHLDLDTSIIRGIGKLVNLQGSIEFHVKNERGHTLEDLNGMSGLRKELHIKNLEVITSQKEACKAGLDKKENLKMLELEWNSTDRSVTSVAADILDGLEPCQHIKKLHIRRYPGNRSPNWLNRSLKESDLYLRYLYLINCRKWEVMPPLGQLPWLKVLHMKEMCSVKQISQEFYGTNQIAFPCLEELQFDDMPNWVEWTQEDRNLEVLPKLRKLKISDCPQLIKVPPLPQSIRMVSVKNSGFASQLKLSVTSSSKPHRFALDTCSTTVLTNGLLHQVQVEAIVSLTLRNCQDAKFEKIQAFTSLRRLQIYNSDINDEQFGTCLPGLLALTSLEIVNCSNITSLPQTHSPDCLTMFYDLQIQHCSEFSSLCALPSFMTLKNLLIESCPNVTAESFPATFNVNSSLRELKIINCAQLESLPSAFPSSLQVLHLIGCKPALMKQLQLQDGSEWDKVAFIPIKHIH